MKAELTLTDAQVKALSTTPITLIAAPGAGKMIVPIAVVMNLKSWVADYTNINVSSILRILYAAGTVEPIVIGSNATSLSVTNLLGFSGNRPSIYGIRSNVVSSTLRPVSSFAQAEPINTALQMSINNQGSGDLTGGNAAQSLIVTVLYEIVNI